MLHTSNPIIKHKAGLLNLAEELGNANSVLKFWPAIPPRLGYPITQRTPLVRARARPQSLNDRFSSQR